MILTYRVCDILKMFILIYMWYEDQREPLAVKTYHRKDVGWRLFVSFSDGSNVFCFVLFDKTVANHSFIDSHSDSVNGATLNQ